LAGISENIHVQSVVDRFLEHSRIFVFGEGPKEQVFLSSADWMPRNFERRVEVMFPVEAEDLRRRIVDEIIPTYLKDNRRARILQPDGTYVRAKAGDEAPHRSQVELLALAASRENGQAIEGAMPVSFEAVSALSSSNGETQRDRQKRKKKRGPAGRR
jgi:polyphosphate kinase